MYICIYIYICVCVCVYICICIYLSTSQGMSDGWECTQCSNAKRPAPISESVTFLPPFPPYTYIHPPIVCVRG